MSKKNNFDKAVYDMFGVGSEEKQAKTVGEAAPLAQPQKADQAPVVKKEIESAPAAAPVKAAQTTYLSPDTVWEGNLKSKGDIEIAGVFVGEIESAGNVSIHTKIKGNITAATLRVEECDLEGDCHVSEEMWVSEKSHVTGNYYVGNMTCAGTITGDTVATGAVTLSATAKVTGDVTAATLSMEPGARIDGRLSMTR